MIAFIKARSSLVEQIHAHQFDDEKLSHSICVTKTGDLIRLILEEAHCSRYSIHPGAAKMYLDLSLIYLWCGIKRDIIDFVSRWLTYQRFKCQH